MLMGRVLQKLHLWKFADKKTVQYLTEKFKERNGNVICRELLKGINNSTTPIAEERNTAYYKKRPCAEYVYDAVVAYEFDIKNDKNYKVA